MQRIMLNHPPCFRIAIYFLFAAVVIRPASVTFAMALCHSIQAVHTF